MAKPKPIKPLVLSVVADDAGKQFSTYSISISDARDHMAALSAPIFAARRNNGFVRMVMEHSDAFADELLDLAEAAFRLGRHYELGVRDDGEGGKYPPAAWRHGSRAYRQTGKRKR